MPKQLKEQALNPIKSEMYQPCRKPVRLMASEAAEGCLHSGSQVQTQGIHRRR